MTSPLDVLYPVGTTLCSRRLRECCPPDKRSALPYGLESEMMTMGGSVLKFERISFDPRVCTGKPCIRDLRFPVLRLLGLLAAGETRESILKAYPYLESEDIEEALRYAAYLAEEETLELSR